MESTTLSINQQHTLLSFLNLFNRRSRWRAIFYYSCLNETPFNIIGNNLFSRVYIQLQQAMIFLSPIYPENRQYIHDRKNSYLSVTVTPPIENFTLFTSIVYLVLPLIVNANIHLNVCLYICVCQGFPYLLLHWPSNVKCTGGSLHYDELSVKT